MIPKPEVTGIRVSVNKAAEIVGKHPSYLRRLWKRGVIPEPKRTAGGRPYFDDDLLEVIMTVMKTGIGLNGEEIMFYRRRKKAARCGRTQQSDGSRRGAAVDPYITQLKKALSQVGVPDDRLKPAAIQAHLAVVFGDQRPPVEVVLRDLAKQLMDGSE